MTNNNWKLVDNRRPDQPTIRVIGLGGAGTNAIRHMLDHKIDGVDFICANTDTQHLYDRGKGATLLQLGGERSNGHGAGANPDVGRQAALDDRERIQELLEGSDMVFIAAGMGGGTGTGSAPVVAEVARELGALTVAVVTKPFHYEGGHRMALADEGLDALVHCVHSLITIPNERLVDHFGHSFKLREAFKRADEVLSGAVRGVSDIATQTGFINVDFEDIRTVMSIRGTAMMGSGSASGENRAETAIQMALSSPLLEDIDLHNAQGVLVNISAAEPEMGEVQDVGNAVGERSSPDSIRVIGAQFDDSLGDEFRVTVVMTGVSKKQNSSESVIEQTNANLRIINGGSVLNPNQPIGKLSPVHLSGAVKSEAAGETRQSQGKMPDIPTILREQLD